MNSYVCNKNNNNNKNNIMNRNWNNQEIMKVINNLNLNSAMAFDMIHYKLIHIARRELVPHLTILFNYVYCNQSECPDIWRSGGICPIPKPGRPAIFCKNIRPISKLPGLCRMLQAGVNFRLIYVCIKYKLIRIGNISFQPNKNTEDITIRMAQLAFKSFERQSFMEMTIMDLKSAYDSVWIEGFFYKLIVLYDFDGAFISFEFNYLNIRFNRVEFDGFITKWVISRRCFAQGDPLMTTFFNIYLNDYKTIQELIEFNNFADDSLLSSDGNESLFIRFDNNQKIEIRKAMQNEIDNFYQYTLDWKLILSYQKCESITISRKNNKFESYVYSVNGTKLKLIHSYEHAPSHCIHNSKQNYHNHERIDDGYISNDSNGYENVNNYVFNKNSENYEKIDKTIDVWNKYRMKNKEMVNMSKYVRILGIMFDPKLFWKEHLNILIQNCKIKLHQLRKIAYCKYYKLSAFAIWKLWLTVIKPKIMYGICTYNALNDSDFYKLEQLQLEAAKIALRVKKQTPTLYVYEFLNILSIKNSLKIMQIKLWNKYSRSANNTLINKTFNEWKEYINKNGKNMSEYTRITRSMINNNNNNNNKINNNLTEIYNIFESKLNSFKYFKLAPLSKAFKTISELMDDNMTPFDNRCQESLRAPPIYEELFPNNIEVLDEDIPNCKIKPIAGSYIFYSDGSCIPNPGPGGSGVYSPNFIIHNKMVPIMHDTTINFAELNAFKIIFEMIRDLYINTNIIEKHITIYTDSRFCCNLFIIIMIYYKIFLVLLMKLIDIMISKLELLKLEAIHLLEAMILQIC